MEPRELEQLLAKVGGKYKLVTLFQKRMRELQRGLPRLVDIESSSPWEVVATEIRANKVELLMGEEADQMRKEIAQREAEEAQEARARGKLAAPAPEVAAPAAEAPAPAAAPAEGPSGQPA